MLVQAGQVLWAALDESSIVDVNDSRVPFREYMNGAGQFINAARIVADGNPARLWMPEYEGEPGYWEEDFPVTCLKDEDGEYPMGEYSSQFDMGDDPKNSMMVIFELGYVADWDDESSPFIALATAQSTYGQLDSEKHIYQAGTLLPPVETNWMPTIFYADTPIPEPSIAILAIFGICAMLLKRKQVI